MNTNGRIFDAEHSLNGWKQKEWSGFQNKLDLFDLEQLKRLATVLGVEFSMGNENITDRDDFTDVLNKAVKEDLLREYKKIIEEKKQIDFCQKKLFLEQIFLLRGNMNIIVASHCLTVKTML